MREGPRAFERLVEEFGDLFTVYMGGQQVFFLTNPDAIRDVLVTNSKNFTKGRALGLAKIALGDGLLTGDGESYQDSRRLIQPSFHSRRISEICGSVHYFLGDLHNRWKNDQEIDIGDEMTELLLKITARGFLGVDISTTAKTLGSVFSDILSKINILNLLPDFVQHLPLPINYRLKQLTGRLNTAAGDIIDLRGNDRTNAQDALSLMLAGQANASRYIMTQKRQRDLVITLLFGGYEAPMQVMTWVWYLIAKHPAVEQRLHHEIDTILAGREPTEEDVGNLSYTKCVLLETMRLYPPVWIIARRIIEPYRIGEFTMPAGAEIFMSPYIVQRNPSYFDDPSTYNPDRWLSLSLQNMPRFRYFPFGGGPRGCLGEHFAWPELLLLISSIARKWTLALKVDREVKPRFAFTFGPSSKIRMILKAR
jgi:cytochrome P450